MRDNRRGTGLPQAAALFDRSESRLATNGIDPLHRGCHSLGELKSWMKIASRLACATTAAGAEIRFCSCLHFPVVRGQLSGRACQCNDDNAIQHWPYSPRSHIERGVIGDIVNEPIEALRAFKNALDLCGQVGSAKLYEGMALRGIGHTLI